MGDRNRADQRGATAEKIVGRDSYETNQVFPRSTHIEKLVALLEAEIERKETRDHLIESLEFFEEPHAPDGIVGLEAKLEKVGRTDSTMLALRYKEMFAKFLSRFSLYHAAQELISLCLHKVLFEFEKNVHPNCGSISLDQIDEIVSDKVIQPLMDEYASGAFSLNHGIIQGMIYWLADRCFIRWHAI